MNDLKEKILSRWDELIIEYPKTGSQQFQKRYPDYVNEVLNYTAWAIKTKYFSDKVELYRNNITEYNKCKCGREIYNFNVKTCHKKDCDAFKILLNKNRDKVKHRQSVIKTYEEGSTRKKTNQKKNADIFYSKLVTRLNDIEPYDLHTTIELLTPIYKNYFGKSGNRKLIRDNIKLYKSVKYHANDIVDKGREQINFVSEMIFICDYNADITKMKCHVDGCNKIRCYNEKNKIFLNNCDYHKVPYMSKEYFKSRYGLEWEEMFQNAMINKSSKASKISQEMLWLIYELLNKPDNCYFYELNQEYRIFTTKLDRELMGDNKKYCFYLDFLDKNQMKIIEFDGIYWHKNSLEYDKIRDGILSSKGYIIHRVDEMDYMTNKEQTIQKCIDFLRS